MILLSHPTGNANVRHAALALAEAGLLDAFGTGVSWPAESVLNHWIPGQIRRELASGMPTSRFKSWRRRVTAGSSADRFPS